MNLRWLIMLAGAALLIAGVVALLVPVSVTGANSESVTCGNAIASDLSAARAADDKSGANVPVLNEFIPHTNFVANCETSLSHRRALAIPLVVIGVLGVGGGLLLNRRPGSPVAGQTGL